MRRPGDQKLVDVERRNRARPGPRARRTPMGTPTPWAGRAVSLLGSFERRLPIRGYVSSALCAVLEGDGLDLAVLVEGLDRKSTRLNSSHANISYAVFC